MKDIKQLMVQYFLNKESIKKLKKERAENAMIGKCTNDNAVPDCITVGFQNENGYDGAFVCEFCTERHRIYIAIQKAAHANSGILKTVKYLTTK